MRHLGPVQHSLDMVHLDRREVGEKPESYERCLRRRVASTF